ncbi:MAG: hypothetical protein V7K69_31800 [Nostoc sp.]
MLFGYPIAATADNWLHECFCHIMQAIHSTVASRNIITEWSKIIPEPYRNRLKSRLQRSGGLGDKLNAYQIALAKLTAEEQNQILQALNDQNKIALLLSCQCDCQAITDLPVAIHKPVKALFKYAFYLLTDPDLEIRDKHYDIIYKSIPSRVCPFCGCEGFDALGSRREALDHYLLKDSYPFAAANLRNLVPMGYKCNSQYKHTKNILYKDNQTRRKSFDPYNYQGVVKISLNNSQPFAGGIGRTGERLPKWEIDFSCASEEITTWDDIFHVRERYIRDVLDAEFNSWLDIFGRWCQRRIIPNSDQELVDAIEDYASDRELEGFGDRGFLKAAVFRMLHIHCQKGNQQLIVFLMAIVNPEQPL